MEFINELMEVQAVEQLVEALCYKPESGRFFSRLGHWIFNSRNSSNPTMALDLTQPLAVRSARDQGSS
jgi:hypothetical protein